MRYFLSGVLMIAMGALTHFVSAQGREMPFPLPAEPLYLETFDAKIKVSVVAEGISQPFGLLILPDGDMLVTDRYQPALRVIRAGQLDQNPLQGLPNIRTGFHSGLLDVEAHPDFTVNRMLYFTYHKALPTDGEYAIALGRARYDGGAQLTEVEELYVGTPITLSGGSRLVFAPDGKLFITTGGAMGRQPFAQDLLGSYGKVLRLNEDGTVPNDNPFVGRDDVLPEIYSYGHRDQYGLTIHPETGELYQAELGPIGGDKINRIKAGGNYGWPLYGYGSYNDSIKMDHPNREGIEPALIIWLPGIVPSGLMFYTGEAFPQWKGHLMTGSIQRGRIPGTGGVERVHFNDEMLELRRETLVTELRQRVRDIGQGPDGFIYILTEEANGAVLKIEPWE